MKYLFAFKAYGFYENSSCIIIIHFNQIQKLSDIEIIHFICFGLGLFSQFLLISYKLMKLIEKF